MRREMTCISCPIGCGLTVKADGGGALEITGNRCSRGEIYAREEILAPKRIVTATMPFLGGDIRRLPVRTDAPLNKELIPELLEELYHSTAHPPVEAGQIIITNFRDTGVNVTATRRGRSTAETA